MSRLKVPSVQHLARQWSSSSEVIKRKLVTTATNPPIFNYNPLIVAAREFLLWDIPQEQLIRGITEKEKREGIRKRLLEVVPLLCEYFTRINPEFTNLVAPRFYPLDRRLRIPFNPNFIYGLNERIYFPWLSFWRSNPLDSEQLSLFVTLVDQMLMQDPDLENAKFQILDFSAIEKKGSRQLTVIDAAEVPRLNQHRLEEMLFVFLEGYEKAVKFLNDPNRKTQEKEADVEADPNQRELWDLY